MPATPTKEFHLAFLKERCVPSLVSKKAKRVLRFDAEGDEETRCIGGGMVTTCVGKLSDTSYIGNVK